MKSVSCSISTVIVPKNNVSQGGMFSEMVETGISYK